MAGAIHEYIPTLVTYHVLRTGTARSYLEPPRRPVPCWAGSSLEDRIGFQNRLESGIVNVRQCAEYPAQSPDSSTT